MSSASRPERPPGWRLIARLAAIGGILARHLVRAAAGKLGAGRRAPSPGEAGAWIAPLLAALGPSFVKIGQVLGTRRDLIPAAWCRALSVLDDRVPPPDRAALERAVGEAHGRGPSLGAPPPEAGSGEAREPPADRRGAGEGLARAPFREIDWTPIASGSIATVHTAVLVDGRTVALKLRRPGIAPVMHLDLALVLFAARLAERLPGLGRLPLVEMAEQVGSAIVRQLDFSAERDALLALRHNLRERPEVRVPEVYAELCTETTLVMELLPDLRRLGPADLGERERRQVVAHTLGAVYQMLFRDGLVHCDLHPGNLYPRPDAGIVIVDGGFVVKMPEKARRLFAEFFIGMVLGRGRRCADIVIESARRIDEDSDLGGFRRAVAELVASVTGARAKTFDLAVFAGRLFDAQRRFGLYAAPEFVFPLMSLLVVEGMVNEFDPEADFQGLALPHLVAALA